MNHSAARQSASDTHARFSTPLYLLLQVQIEVQFMKIQHDWQQPKHCLIISAFKQTMLAWDSCQREAGITLTCHALSWVLARNDPDLLLVLARFACSMYTTLMLKPQGVCCCTTHTHNISLSASLLPAFPPSFLQQQSGAHTLRALTCRNTAAGQDVEPSQPLERMTQQAEQ